MNTQFKKRLFSAILIVPLFVNAFHNNNGNIIKPSNNFKTESGDCAVPKSQVDLDINNVRTKILNGGDLWTDGTTAKYEVPKGDGTQPINAIFAGSIWVSGLANGNNLKIAAMTYRQDNGVDFYAGPLDASGTTSNSVCALWDNNGFGHFNVYGSEISILQGAYKSQGGCQTQPCGTSATLTGSVLTKNILNWPGKGNATLAAKGYDVTENLAPFYDANNDGKYTPEFGDYPTLGGASDPKYGVNPYADQMIFWVLNDKGNNHNGSGGQAMGIQINALAFAFKTTDEINNMTFYSYELLNKSGVDYQSTYISQFVDVDLGCYSNDFLGCDTARSMGFAYNGVANDGLNCGSGTLGYGTQLPMIAFDFFEGPKDSTGKQLGLSSFNYFNNGNGGPQNDPSNTGGFRNYMEGFWANKRPFVQNGSGYLPSGGVPTKYCFPGNPSVSSGWSECHTQTSQAQVPGDRRMLLTSGAFTMKSYVPQKVTIGVLFVRPAGTGVGTCPDVNYYLGKADDKAQALFDNGFKLLDGPDAPTLVIKELPNSLIINLENLASSNNSGESYKKADLLSVKKNGFTTPPSNMDSNYTFQGYRIYQLANDRVSATDLDDVTKAVEIAQYDIKDGITRLVNYETDVLLGMKLPKVKVDGNDNGIKHSLSVTEDKFAQGTDIGLVNNKTYYFTAVAYASNQFLPYTVTYSGGTLSGEQGQDVTYLQGRGNFARYSAIPHSVNGEQETLNSKWGDGVKVTRIEGMGNGANNVLIDPAQYDKLIYSGLNKLDTLSYLPNGDPLGFKITNPFNVKEGDFEVTVHDTVTYDGAAFTKKAYWTMKELSANPVRTFSSEKVLDRANDQLITYLNGTTLEDYGFQLSLGRPNQVNTRANVPGSQIFETGNSTIVYSDPKNTWLQFVKDAGQADASNWIRSGHYYDQTYKKAFSDNSDKTTFPGPYYFYDSLNQYDKMAGGTWAPYCLATNFHIVGALTGDVNSVYGPAFKWKRYQDNDAPKNNLDSLHSVDIIFTSDKSKWSRCVVFEAGEDQDNNLGASVAPYGKNSRKGMIRMANSWNPFFGYHDGNNSLPLDTGRSWFPGFAVDVETGQRLNVAFAEASDLISENGADMKWNPTSKVYSDNTGPAPITKLPVFGGRHFVYVMNTPYDEGEAMQTVLLAQAANMASSVSVDYQPEVKNLYSQIMYTSIPVLNSGASLDPNTICPNDVAVHLRVGRPYQKFETQATRDLNVGDSLPRYFFSTKGKGTTKFTTAQAKSALDNIRIVPNPYLAYSSYEISAPDTKVKITNLPRNCTISIYSLDGTLIKVLRRNIGDNVAIENGGNIDEKGATNLDDAVIWDMKNDRSIPIAAGVYLFDVQAPGIGSKILRWFGALRPTDVSNF